MSCVISIAFYYAREYYNIVREMPTGKGFADIVMIPRKMNSDKPAILIELKWLKWKVKFQFNRTRFETGIYSVRSPINVWSRAKIHVFVSDYWGKLTQIYEKLNSILSIKWVYW